MSADAELHPSEVDWADVYQQIGVDPDQPITGESQMLIAVTLSDQVPVDDETEAAEFVSDALQLDGLSKTDDGYVIDEYAVSTVDETETETDDDDGDENEPEPEVVNETTDDQAIDELRSEVARLKAVNRRQDQLITMLLGERDLSAVEPEDMRPVMDRLRVLEDRVGDLEEDNEHRLELSEVSHSRPDERAEKLRHALLNHAGSDGRAALTRDDVDAILGGLHRGQLLEAMKRAADGRRASDEDRRYSPIPGTSDLSPVDAITFEVGKESDDQSRIVLDTDDLTGSEARQNFMTGGET
jgi:hypothetical protein